MATGHGGHAGHMPGGGDRKALIISGILTEAYFFIELGVGLWSGSVAVISGVKDVHHVHAWSVTSDRNLCLGSHLRQQHGQRWRAGAA